MTEHNYFGQEVELDFESRSPVTIEDVGLYNYIFHPQTEPLFLWYKIGKKGEWQCWRIWEDKFIDRSGPIWSQVIMPTDLHAAIIVQGCPIVAFNSVFERYMTKKLGWDIPAENFIDPQVGGRYGSLPASLDVQCEVLGVPSHLAKDRRGKELIKLFCEKVRIKATKKRPATEYWNDWNSHPDEWNAFLEYGKRDVIAESELLRRMRLLGFMPLPPFEQELWLFDQTVNDRGMPVDRVFVDKLYRLGLRAKDEAKLAFEAMTGVKNANSPAQIKAWASTQGYPYPSINKDVVASALKDPNLKLTDTCRAALKMRREAASTSYQKLGKILTHTSSDNVLRNQFVFMGSPRCGRWAGNAVQLHNMARPVPIKVMKNGEEVEYDFEDQAVVREARALVHGEQYDEIKARYGTVLLVVKNLIRTAFVAPGNEGQ